MKILFFLIITCTLLLSCSGDCMKCHPNLVKDGSLDKDHMILTSCKECHTIENGDLEKMGSLCGQDCWDCHSVEKTKQVQNEAHYALDRCIKCHSKLNKDDFLNNSTNWLK
ncbi:hypothetical protein [Sulfurospirillum arcachonense]|uniref:hypothetical protein n=1 Tax=Sulfurospirillum arcachonense TaxID=57666 RepID=UPI000467F084|nr:hypothetical protein [Sulfurospirillum arcachonense]